MTYMCVCSVTKSILILCNPMDCSSLGSSVHEISQPRVGCHFFLQRSFPTQEQNLHLLHALAGVFFTTEPPGKSNDLHGVL